MEFAYRLVIYIIMANIAYMIFSLWLKGFKHYSGYISQLFFLLCLTIVLTFKDFNILLTIAVSIGGIVLLVIWPMFIQRKIDGLLNENKLENIEYYARIKANLVWSELNIHLLKIAKILNKYSKSHDELIEKLKKILVRGEPYDSVTRIYIANIHFNNRNFHQLIKDLVAEDRDYNEYSFEELMYISRSFLETTRYKEAVQAQLALEKKKYNSHQADWTADQQASLEICRIIFFALMGWKEQFDKANNYNKDSLNRLPESLAKFWEGVMLFNAGDFEDGERIMGAVMASCGGSEETEDWLPFMRKRFFGMIENKEFFKSSVLPELQQLKTQFKSRFESSEEVEQVKKSAWATNFLLWTNLVVSISIMFYYDIHDIVSLIEIGANSAFLVNHGEYFRLITYQFIHIGWLHLIMNSLALKIFGEPVEAITGVKLFFGLYLFSGIAGGLMAVSAGQTLSAGASASVLGLLSAAIIFELFKVDGGKSTLKNNNFTTLVFILIINLVIGFIEPGVDNSAHMGGLIAGGAISFLMLPLFKSTALKKTSGLIAVVVCLLITFASLWQMFTIGKNTYPNAYVSYIEVEGAEETVKLLMPESWEIDHQAATAYALYATGPFRERFELSRIANSDPVETVIEKYIYSITRDAEEVESVSVARVIGPSEFEQKKDTYSVVCVMKSQVGPLSAVSYLYFKPNHFYLVRFYIGTERFKSYNDIMETIIESLSEMPINNEE